MSFDTIILKKNPACKVCGEHPQITELIDYEEFCGVPSHGHTGSAGKEWDITASELAHRLAQGEDLHVIDVREPQELVISKLGMAQLIPLGQLASRISELDSNQEIVLICKKGNRSTLALKILTAAGFSKLKNLKGGINAWAEDVDDSIIVY